ncbi:MAG TPA: hypothetical protein VJM15_02835 [Sphingomicrobium sp.]|nr:hypothetical protein [Sphingomicrobium sp.]
MTYSLIYDPNVWVISGLVFLLGLLVGMFLTAGGRRKWKARYKDEVASRESWEREHARLKADYDDREKEWRERDSLRAAAVRDRDRVEPLP